MNENQTYIESVMDRTEARELFCKDFDFSCFELSDAEACKRGKTAVIHGLTYFTIPVIQICPLCDRING